MDRDLELPGSGWSTSSPWECSRYPTSTGSSLTGCVALVLRLAGAEWAGAYPGTSRGGVAEGERGIVACVPSALAKSDSKGAMFIQSAQVHLHHCLQVILPSPRVRGMVRTPEEFANPWCPSITSVSRPNPMPSAFPLLSRRTERGRVTLL